MVLKKSIKAVVSNHIKIYRKDFVDDAMRITLCNQFTYKNPKYLLNQKYGYSNHNTPRYIKTFEDIGQAILFPRGGIKKIEKVFKSYKAPIVFEYKTFLPVKEIFPKHKIIPREEQEEFINTLLKESMGCGQAYPSFGKCHAKGTKILMYSGHLKKVEDIKIGDLLMGIDSTPREVTNTCIGFGKMYRIKPNYGKPFTVNGEHILSLKMSGHIQQTKLRPDEILNVTVNDFLNLSNWKKHHLKLRRPEKIIFRGEDILAIPPYLLGVWIAEGHIRTSGFTISDDDIEIKKYLYFYAKKNNFNIREERDTRRCSEIFLSENRSFNGNKNINKLARYLISTLKKGEKRIPKKYLLSSYENRLEVLAGILDGDGHLVKSDNKTLEIFTKKFGLSCDIKFLSMSLGFKISRRKIKTSYRNKGEKIFTGHGYRMFISGDTERIPLKVKRKKPSNHKTRTNHLLTGFKIKQVDDDNYYGFTLDKDKLYMTDDFIINHNTVCGLVLAQKLGYSFAIFVHTEFLQKQWIETALKMFNYSPHMIGGFGGVFREKKNFFTIFPSDAIFRKNTLSLMNVILYQSMKQENVDLLNNKIGLVIVDEGQKSVIENIETSVNSLKCHYKYSVSANFRRKDGKQFVTFDTLGSIKIVMEDKESDSKIPCEMYSIPSEYVDNNYYMDNNIQIAYGRMSRDKERNTLICKRVINRVKQGRLCIIFTQRQDHAGILYRMLSNYRVALLLGTINKDYLEDETISDEVKNILRNYDDKKAYDLVKDLGESKKLDIIIATQKAEVGLSINAIEYGLLGMPVPDQERLNQIKGRIERTFSDKNKKAFGRDKLTPVFEIIIDQEMTWGNKMLVTLKEFFKKQYKGMIKQVIVRKKV